MAEVAGLVLGGIPLIVLAMQSYREALEWGRKYRKYDDLLLRTKDAVLIQQEQLYKTFDEIGLHEPNYDELEARLQELYPGKHGLFMREIGRMEVTVNNLMEELCLDSLGRVFNPPCSPGKVLMLIEVQPKWSKEQLARMRHEWRRIKAAVTSGETEKLIGQLQERNNQLSRCLRRPEIVRGQSSPMVQAVRAQFNLRRFDTVRQHACAIKDTLDACWHCSCSDQHPTSLDLSWQYNPPESFPKFGISLAFTNHSKGLAITNGLEWRKIQTYIEGQYVDTHQTKAVQVLGLRSGNATQSTITQQAPTFLKGLLSKNQPQVLKVSPSATITTASSAPRSSEIKSLCQFLQGLDKNCGDLGFLLVPGEEKRVHITPVTTPRIAPTEMVTLDSLMSPKRSVTFLGLSRKKRFEIAAAAAWATLLLYDTPWLTDTWDKTGLYFFLDRNAADHNIHAASPCVSTMVNKAKNARRFQSKLIRDEAVFALGVLLIELCLDSSLDELGKTMNATTNSNSIIEDYKVANNSLDRVFLDAGDFYGNACRLCLRFEFYGRDVLMNFGEGTFRQEFYNEVVAPVQATFSAMPR
ncbi:hypothetical protein D6D10_06798 [Aureobasidium pullulans]|uniref:DUF7580 domain-containing protein n=1 Tax=Aureobasidium pullulans TaxID=5580 RepID=A0A4V4J7J6_AURPU|nr:hypothetical protein D6D10_06798 [Aureobasidium pullulans]